tara:strand:- start:947 stop:1126 length:180 start_codon:yes stop_codon:yes gene_type:complete
MIKQWIKTVFKCKPTFGTKYLSGKKTTPEIPRRTSMPALDRRIAASRNIIDGSLMDKDK